MTPRISPTNLFSLAKLSNVALVSSTDGITGLFGTSFYSITVFVLYKSI